MSIFFKKKETSLVTEMRLIQAPSKEEMYVRSI